MDTLLWTGCLWGTHTRQQQSYGGYTPPRECLKYQAGHVISFFWSRYIIMLLCARCVLKLITFGARKFKHQADCQIEDLIFGPSCRRICKKRESTYSTVCWYVFLTCVMSEVGRTSSECRNTLVLNRLLDWTRDRLQYIHVCPWEPVWSWVEHLWAIQSQHRSIIQCYIIYTCIHNHHKPCASMCVRLLRIFLYIYKQHLNFLRSIEIQNNYYNYV